MVKNVNATGQYGNSQLTVSSIAGKAAYTTIQEAVTDSGGTGTIYILPGTYTESIAWPSGISVVAATVGEDSFDVVISGNQTFVGNGNLSFENVSFTASAGDTWTQSAPVATGALEFDDCKIESSLGKGIVTGTTGINLSSLFLRSSEISSALQAIDASGNSILDINSTRLAISTDNINCVDMADATSLTSDACNLNTSGIGTGSCIALAGATNSVDSQNTRYNAGNAATASAFEFAIAGGSIRSVKDEMFVAGGTFWVRSTGAFGSLSYANNIINTGTTSAIDPQITETLLVTIPPGFTWSTVASGLTMVPENGYLSTAAGAQNFALPTTGAAVGSLLELAQNGAGLVTITQAAGQQIRFGTLQTTVGVGGSLSSTIQGDAIKLVCVTANTTFQAVTGIIGTWNVV